MKLVYNERELTPEHLADLWINGHYFHDEPAKRDELERLHMFGLGRFNFIGFVGDTIRHVLYVDNIIRHALRDGCVTQRPLHHARAEFGQSLSLSSAWVGGRREELDELIFGADEQAVVARRTLDWVVEAHRVKEADPDQLLKVLAGVCLGLRAAVHGLAEEMEAEETRRPLAVTRLLHGPSDRSRRGARGPRLLYLLRYRRPK